MASYYNDQTILWLDGEFLKASEAKTDLYSQSLHYGYAAFEGIRSYRTAEGQTKIFKATEHFILHRHTGLGDGALPRRKAPSRHDVLLSTAEPERIQDRSQGSWPLCQFDHGQPGSQGKRLLRSPAHRYERVCGRRSRRQYVLRKRRTAVHSCRRQYPAGHYPRDRSGTVRTAGYPRRRRPLHARRSEKGRHRL